MKFIQHFQVFEKFVDTFKGVCPDLFQAEGMKDCFSLFWIIPEIGLLGNKLFVFYFNDLTIVVKDTSSRRSYEPSSLSTDLLSS